jgi:hypothetical protein
MRYNYTVTVSLLKQLRNGRFKSETDIERLGIIKRWDFPKIIESPPCIGISWCIHIQESCSSGYVQVHKNWSWGVPGSF